MHVRQWVGPGAFAAVARVQSLVRYLKSHKLYGMAPQKKRKKEKKKWKKETHIILLNPAFSKLTYMEHFSVSYYFYLEQLGFTYLYF